MLLFNCTIDFQIILLDFAIDFTMSLWTDQSMAFRGILLTLLGPVSPGKGRDLLGGGNHHRRVKGERARVEGEG